MDLNSNPVRARLRAIFMRFRSYAALNNKFLTPAHSRFRCAYQGI